MALLCQGCNTGAKVAMLCNSSPPLWVPAPSPLLGAGPTPSGALGHKSPRLALLIPIWTLWDKLRPCSLPVPLSHPGSICTRGCDLPAPDPGLHGAEGQENYCDKTQCDTPGVDESAGAGSTNSSPPGPSPRPGTALASRAALALPWRTHLLQDLHLQNCASFSGQGLLRAQPLPATALQLSPRAAAQQGPSLPLPGKMHPVFRQAQLLEQLLS